MQKESKDTMTQERKKPTNPQPVVCKIDKAGYLWTREFPSVRPGTEIVFHAEKTDCVLCISDPSVFGESRIEIPQGESRHLTVREHHDGGEIRFRWSTKVGHLNWACADTNEGTGGGYPPPR